MTTLSEFVSRELLFLAVTAALGSWPASFLSERVPPVARAALAPALGMCLGTVVFTSTLWFLPARDTYWLVPLLSGLSVAGAILRLRARLSSLRNHKTIRRLTLGFLPLALVVILVSTPTVYTFVQNNSVGPVTYLAPDSGAYTLTIDAMIHESLHTAEVGRSGPWPDLSEAYLAQYMAGFQEVDIDLSRRMWTHSLASVGLGPKAHLCLLLS